MKNWIAVSLILITQPVLTKAAKLSTESHRFHIHGEVEYRCYAGYAAGRAKADIFNSKTHPSCDNQSYKKSIVDNSIKVKIEREPSPDDNSDLSGGWDEKCRF